MALLVDSLAVRRGERMILSGLSFRAEPGEALLLVGPNGAGKTTLLRTLAGLIAPDEGSIRRQGGLTDEPGALAADCHLVGHRDAVKSALTVAENALFWARYLGGTPAGAMAALAHFRLADLAEVTAGYLSAGQKRRLGLARLLLAPRPVWLLDEPAVSLDTASRALLAAAVNGHLAAAGIVVAATHQPLGFAPSRELVLGVGTAAGGGAAGAPAEAASP